ncbi:sulfotransferase family 2 domain-containing protein [Pseudoruegeria sp. HB172150]|uniref:sulfotransferase family 2 domain-containing protein n=1 Tax=Pseudoruegeria sp. HB172150 TaxID=2721164 RepID=UPI001553D316|nr:sulfotransferase family 2 domain-containing protein [Pseudoruegeria sp. HB172150]
MEQAIPATQPPEDDTPALERHYLLLPGAGLAYCRIPKAANSSVRFLLAKQFRLASPDPGLRPNQDRYWLTLPAAQAVTLTAADYAALPADRRPWCFTLVRNPVARLYSAWNNKVIENRALSRRFLDMGVTSGMGFDAFVDRVAASPDESCDIHVRSQMAILAGNGRLLPDFIGRVEKITADWSHIRYELRARRGLRLPALPHKNARAEVQADIAQRIAPDVLRKIAARYRADFEQLYPGLLDRIP